MKFGRALQNTSKRFPKMPFVRYTILKQILKCILLEADYYESSQLKEDNNEITPLIPDYDFEKILNQEVYILNEYFIGKEEELVIRMQDLETASQELDSQLIDKFLSILVKFHRDVTLLHYWEIINYTAFSKILKKHDKLISGVSIREAFLESLFHQPFYSTELLDVLSKQCEKLINKLVPLQQQTKNDDSKSTSNSISLNIEGYKFTGLSKLHYAINTWRDLGENAHTPSTILPWSKPLPESMKIWLASQDGGNDSDSYVRIEDIKSKSPTTVKESKSLEDDAPESKRSRSDKNENISTKDSTEVDENQRAKKAARIIE
eukprot:g2259.t1